MPVNIYTTREFTCIQEYNIPNGDESEAERLERLLVEEAVARRIEVSHVDAQAGGGEAQYFQDPLSVLTPDLRFGAESITCGR